jgi:excinuclease ABC subunit B
VRIELFDDEVETHRSCSTRCTGEMRQTMPRFTVYPASHYVTPRRRCWRAIETIKTELARAARELFDAQGKLVEAQRLEQRTRFDLEMLQEMGYCTGIENYSRHLVGRAGRASRRRRWSTTCPTTR